MWVSKTEMRRLLAQVSAAESRAQRAEDSLAAERARHDWLSLQLTSRVVTKHGGYGLDHEPPTPALPDPRNFVRVPSAEDDAKREYYIRCFREAGKSEEEAVALWEAEMRGEQVRYPYEDTEDQPAM
jgi:hypothetical protein